MTFTPRFTDDPALAEELDAADPLASFRQQFHFPRVEGDGEALYFCGNSLGLQPRGARAVIEQELADWAALAVDAHFDGTRPWYPYHEQFAESAARIVGARPTEVVMMNGLTANLHLLMVSFYRPRGKRTKILVDAPTFPSDLYALQSQIAFHGGDPATDLLRIEPSPGRHTIDTEEIEALLAQRGDEIALTLLSGVNYFTGQLFDIGRITRAAHARGCIVGFDLAHAAGNAALSLHDDDVDFAAWCSYKYLNCGPGAVAGCFVHQRHVEAQELHRFAGWWGNDPATRFEMDRQQRFVPRQTAEGWQLSNPPILAMAPMVASFELFDRATMAALRAKSERLTGYMLDLLDGVGGERFEVITPREPAARGCQLSLLIKDRPKERQQALQAEGIVCDFRPPNVIRVAPVPLYNRFGDVRRLVEILARDA